MKVPGSPLRNQKRATESLLEMRLRQRGISSPEIAGSAYKTERGRDTLRKV